MNRKGSIPSPTHQARDDKSHRTFNVAGVFLLLSFLLFLCQLINLGTFETSARGSDRLPVSIRAESQADYSGDAHAPSIPPISGNILRQIILDMPSTISPEDRLATLEFSLSQPVPTMTLDTRFTATFTPTRTLKPTRTRISSHTPTSTPAKLLTSSRTATPTRTSTRTPTAAQTETPAYTSTSRPTTALASTRTPTPTATRFDPTRTPTPTQQIPPTATPTSTPTSTEVVISGPSSQTEVPVCALTSNGISISGNELQLTLTNNGVAPVTIASIRITWIDEPDAQTLTEVRFGDVTIANADDPRPPSDYPSERHWSASQDDLTLAVSESSLLVFLFSEDLRPDNYSIDITFDNGCTVGESR